MRSSESRIGTPVRWAVAVVALLLLAGSLVAGGDPIQLPPTVEKRGDKFGGRPNGGQSATTHPRPPGG